jgi:hypothetical protein
MIEVTYLDRKGGQLITKIVDCKKKKGGHQAFNVAPPSACAPFGLSTLDATTVNLHLLSSSSNYCHCRGRADEKNGQAKSGAQNFQKNDDEDYDPPPLLPHIAQYFASNVALQKPHNGTQGSCTATC